MIPILQCWKGPTIARKGRDKLFGEKRGHPLLCGGKKVQVLDEGELEDVEYQGGIALSRGGGCVLPPDRVWIRDPCEVEEAARRCGEENGFFVGGARLYRGPRGRSSIG